MTVIVDTHVLLWFVAGDKRLTRHARSTIESEENTCYVSLAAWWEVAIKLSLERLRLDEPLDAFIESRIGEGFRSLPVEVEHIAKVATLPFHHRDPFDRLMISQSIEEDMPVVTGDVNFSKYGIRVIWG